MQRREVLKALGVLGVGGVALGMGLAKSFARPEGEGPHPLPWPYAPLDPQKAADRAYPLYFKGG